GDMLFRRTADLENMRKRFHQERSQLIYDANRRLIGDLLPTLDDLERTLEHAAEDDPLRQGVELIHKNFVRMLEGYGLKPMATIGKQFDAHLHDALMEMDSTTEEPGMIINEIQKG